jgi:hypothetical protein
VTPTRREVDQLKRLAADRVGRSASADRNEMLALPNVIDFAVGAQYLNRPGLYPRQATFLKALFLQDDLFTDYDHQVIAEWSEGYKLPEPTLTPRFNVEGEIDTSLRYQGFWGCQPDLYERIRINKEAGRKWFREAVIVIGRRGSKNHLGAIAGAYVLWHYIVLGDPQDWYGVDPDKRLAALVFANKKEHAKLNQWRDLNQVVLGAPCFRELIAQSLGESLKIYAPHDKDRIAAREGAGIDFDPSEMATFLIEPREATLMGGRGPAAFLLFFDEMAYVVASSGAARSADEVYGSATPAREQFGDDAFIYEPSSPWQMMGQFYQNWLNALEVEHTSHRPVYPEMFTIQLESWDIYEDWERATKIPMYPGGPCFQHLKRPIIAYDAAMRRAERANPEKFAVEHRAHWAAAMDAYLSPQRIDEMFGPWGGRVIQQADHGILSRRYVAHADPSKSNANFALAIGHVEESDENGLNHVVYDLIHHWEPADFPDHIIDYIAIEEQLKGYIDDFMPATLTFDQFNSVGIIQRLQRWASARRYPKRVEIHERTATKETNWKVAEVFKTAMNLGHLHAPYDELAELECRFLIDKGNHSVDHPGSGPVQTKDLFDALSNVAYALIGDQMMAILGERLSGAAIPAAQGGFAPFAGTGINPNENSRSAELAAQFRAFRRSNLPGAGSSPRRMGRYGRQPGYGYPRYRPGGFGRR